MLKLLLNLLVYPLTFALKRRELRWAFGAADNAFEGNSRALFLWVSRFQPDVDAIWISGDKSLVRRLRELGYKAHARWSSGGAFAALSSSVHFVTRNGGDVNFSLSGGSTVFNLWHGVGVKNILRGATVGRNASLFRARWFPPLYFRSLERFRAPELVLSTSPTMTAHFARSFGVPASRCVEAGYPRQDPSFDETLRQDSLAFDRVQSFEAARRDFNRIYLYAPTLRQGAPDILRTALPQLGRLSDALRRHDAMIFLKPHPLNPAPMDGAGSFENIRDWPSGLDFYSVLSHVDCLITDYSSMLYDYIDVHAKGVIIYDFDYEEFTLRERDLAFPFDENIVGLRAKTFESLCAHVESDAAATPLDPERLATLRRRFWGRSGPRRSCASALICERLIGGAPIRARRPTAAPGKGAPDGLRNVPALERAPRR